MKFAPHNKGLHLDPEYFWSFVERGDGCWLWTGHRNAKGYGHISVNGRLVLTHRHAWALERGPVPPKLFVLHHCDTPPCVRPDHLYVGTKADNARDREIRGRGNHYVGEAHGCARLTELQAREILRRALSGEQHIDLAAEFDINYRTVGAIARREIWKHL